MRLLESTQPPPNPKPAHKKLKGLESGLNALPGLLPHTRMTSADLRENPVSTFQVETLLI